LDELAARVHTSREQALATLFADEIGPEIRHCAHELRRSQAYDVDGIVAELASRHSNEIVDGYESVMKKFINECDTTGKDHTRKKLVEMVWEDQAVPIRNPELVVAILKVQDADARLNAASGQDESVDGKSEPRQGGRRGSGTRSKTGVAAYDAILLALSDAEETARKLTEVQQVCV
jgi:signal recognition particle subunit SRP68